VKIIAFVLACAPSAAASSAARRDANRSLALDAKTSLLRRLLGRRWSKKSLAAAAHKRRRASRREHTQAGPDVYAQSISCQHVA
jgi:hypothetical protein